MKVVLSTVLDFDSLEDLAAACIDCIENNDLTSLDKGVPEDWYLLEVWDEETIKQFLLYNGSVFTVHEEITYDGDLFDTRYNKTRVEIED